MTVIMATICGKQVLQLSFVRLHVANHCDWDVPHGAFSTPPDSVQRAYWHPTASGCSFGCVHLRQHALDTSLLRSGSSRLARLFLVGAPEGRFNSSLQFYWPMYRYIGILDL